MAHELDQRGVPGSSTAVTEPDPSHLALVVQRQQHQLDAAFALGTEYAQAGVALRDSFDRLGKHEQALSHGGRAAGAIYVLSVLRGCTPEEVAAEVEAGL